MKKPMLLLICLAFLAAGCADRTPSPPKTANIAKGYFKRYGKKYKESEFGQSKVSQVEVKEVRELQKNVATAFLLVKLENGSEIPAIMTLIRKLPGGWRTTSWEWVRN